MVISPYWLSQPQHQSCWLLLLQHSPFFQGKLLQILWLIKPSSNRLQRSPCWDFSLHNPSVNLRIYLAYLYRLISSYFNLAIASSHISFVTGMLCEPTSPSQKEAPFPLIVFNIIIDGFPLVFFACEIASCMASIS